MNQKEQSTAGQSFGIVGLILGIIALLFSFIPCIGMFALIPGILAIIFSILSLNQANQRNGLKSLAIAALVVSIVATLIATVWLLFFTELKNKHKDKIDFIEQFSDEIDEQFENMQADSFFVEGNNNVKVNVDIINDDGDTLRIKAK